ncbi:peptidylprolyl isomerase [Kamptonema cortianum]|nr:peptidylprolyl isomerase [Geitlerinema splendidum]MDK3156216.1 peptidylprolyl isomerase [Kamptonema cortianum]
MKRLWTLFVTTALVMPSIAGAPEFAKASMTLNVAGKGEIVIELYPDKAPQAVGHITALADQGFYNGQKFFRVIKDPRPFLVLFGDPQTKTMDVNDSRIGEGGSGKRIAYENSGLTNKKGAVGLSTKQGDRNGGDSQFYILLDDKPFLDGTYTVFGQVAKGMDIVSRIEVGDQVTSVSVSRG